MAVKTNTYQVTLPQFEGPFDLLLFFIERDELDIHDIAIAKLTNDFLEYIREMERLNIELASEFMLVAATLMRIKAKMLLPRKELNEEGEEIDPRAALVQRLIEYKRFKEVQADMQALEHERTLRFARGNLDKELRKISNAFADERELRSLDLYKLMKVFHKVLNRFQEEKNQQRFEVVKYPYTISGEKSGLKSVLKIHSNGECYFNEVFSDCTNRVWALYRFLSILELIQEGQVGVRLGMGLNNFWLFLLNDSSPESTDTIQAAA